MGADKKTNAEDHIHEDDVHALAVKLKGTLISFQNTDIALTDAEKMAQMKQSIDESADKLAKLFAHDALVQQIYTAFIDPKLLKSMNKEEILNLIKGYLNEALKKTYSPEKKKELEKQQTFTKK